MPGARQPLAFSPTAVSRHVAALLALLAGAVALGQAPTGPLPGDDGSAYDLQSPLPAPARLLGWPAPPSLPAIQEALDAKGEFLIAFVGRYSRYYEGQQRELEALADPAVEAMRVVTVDAADAASEGAIRDYWVSGVPSLVLVTREGIVARVWESVTGAALIVEAAKAAREGPPPSRAALPYRTGTGGSRPRIPTVTPDLPSEGGTAGEPAGLTATATSASLDCGPERLVDGLLAGDPGFRPWVSSVAVEPPMDIEVRFPAPRELRGLEIVARTGPASLFARRWPLEVEVLARRVGGTDPESLTTLTVGTDGAPVRADLAEPDVEAVVFRILSLQGAGRVCELAELRIW